MIMLDYMLCRLLLPQGQTNSMLGKDPHVFPNSTCDTFPSWNTELFGSKEITQLVFSSRNLRMFIPASGPGQSITGPPGVTLGFTPSRGENWNPGPNSSMQVSD